MLVVANIEPRWLLTVSLFLLPVFLLPLAASSAEKPLDTGICDIAADPLRFDGKLVRVRAKVISGFEIFAIGDPSDECESIWLTYSGGSPAAFISIGAKTAKVNRPEVILKRNRQFRRFEKYLNTEMHPRSRGHICMACNRYEVVALLTGRLDHARENGTGFGHLNAFSTQFVLQSVEQVTPIDVSSSYDPGLFSTEPVRFPTGYISGKLLGPTGEPIADADIQVVSIEDVPLYLHDFEVQTDEKGRFKFEVPPGTYVLGINTDGPPSPKLPFATSYFPDTPSIKAAKQIKVTDRQHVRNVTMRVRRELIERRIPVRVLWPDGRPVSNANVWLSEVSRPTSIVGGVVSHTDSNGSFTLIGFEGIDYLLRANIYVKPTYKPHCAEKVQIGAAEPNRTWVVVLALEGEGCRGIY